MTSFLRRWLAVRPVTPTTVYPRFRPTLSALDDRITPTLNFAAAQLLNTGGSTFAVTTADFNNDGRPDLATANDGTDTVSVRLNATTAGATSASFAAAQSFAVGDGPSSVVAADFNSDGRPDLATANENANTVSVRLNTTAYGAGSASFAAAQSLAVGTFPIGLATGDFNGDGRPDLVTVNYSANTASVRLNTTAVGATSATFATAQTFAVGTDPRAVAVADFNGDGRPDLIVANQYADTVSVRLNATANGATSASFATAVTFAVGQTPSSLAIADFNGDGRPDFATGNQGANTVSVRANTTAAGASTPTFGGLYSYAAGASGSVPTAVVAADFNGDGKPDLATANESASTVSVRPNTSAVGATTPTFTALTAFNVGAGPDALTVADLNADGRPDIVTANGSANNASVRLNTSDGLLTTGPVLTGQFGTGGVWAYNRVLNQWAQLTSSNANLLATAPNGNILANFLGYGVYYYRPASGWTQLNGTSASAIAIDQYGNPYVSWDGYGTFVYRFATGQWNVLTNSGTAGANKLAVAANGDVIVNYASYGLYRFRWSVGWTQIDTKSAVAMAVGENGAIAASFNGYGTYLNRPATGWTQINGVTASSLAAGANGAVAAVFPGYGVSKYIPYANGWASLTNNGAGTSVAMDLFGNVYASFTGAGVWEFDASYGWRQRTTSDASILGLGR